MIYLFIHFSLFLKRTSLCYGAAVVIFPNHTEMNNEISFIVFVFLCQYGEERRLLKTISNLFKKERVKKTPFN